MNSTWLITSELANQRARKVLFTCVAYAKTIIHLSVGESGRYFPPLRWITGNGGYGKITNENTADFWASGKILRIQVPPFPLIIWKGGRQNTDSLRGNLGHYEICAVRSFCSWVYRYLKWFPLLRTRNIVNLYLSSNCKDFWISTSSLCIGPNFSRALALKVKRCLVSSLSIYAYVIRLVSSPHQVKALITGQLRIFRHVIKHFWLASSRFWDYRLETLLLCNPRCSKMSAAPFTVEMIFVFLLTLCLLHQYGNWRKQHWLVTIAVFIAWYFSFLIVFILPLDVSAVSFNVKARKLL